MKADDPRHGTDAGYWTHRRHHQSACRPCRVGHYRATTQAKAEEAALTDGRWINKGLIKVWLPDPVVMSRADWVQGELDLEAAS